MSTIEEDHRSALPRTLGEFFVATGREYRIYDVGRRVSAIAAPDFAAFERAEQAYPLPLKRRAWLGILFWEQGDPSDPMIWFLQFPLDEQGCLVQAARDYVLRRLFEAYGHRLSSPQENEAASLPAANVLADNPLAFRPAEDRLAMFRALSGAALGHSPSRFHAAARAYFVDAATSSGRGDWRELGIQGIADLVARQAAEETLGLMHAVLEGLAPEPFVALCTCLESTAVPSELSAALIARAERALAEGEDSAVVAAAIRGCSQAQRTGDRDRLVDLALESSRAVDIEVLAAVAGRAWESLDDPGRVARFIERLACNDAGQEGFAAIAGELLFMPGMRAGTLAAMRDRERSPQVRLRVEEFLESLHC